MFVLNVALRNRDAWHSQQGLTKTEAKRLYISYLIDNMTRYAMSTPEARELVSELSFVWDQIKNLSPQQSSSSEETSSQSRLTRIGSRGEPLLEFEPRNGSAQDWEGALFSDGDENASVTRSDRRFRRRVIRAIETLRADVARLHGDIGILRLRIERPEQRDGVLLIFGRWISRFVGVYWLACDLVANIVPSAACII